VGPSTHLDERNLFLLPEMEPEFLDFPVRSLISIQIVLSRLPFL
jgi:hypothetical protein